MIFNGESVLSILFEGGDIVTKEGVRLRHLNAAAATAATATVMLNVLHKLYTNDDNTIAKGSVHAIPEKTHHRHLWGQLHVFYHMSLVLFDTGLGLAVHESPLPFMNSI